MKESNIRTTIVIPKELKEHLTKIAEQQNRSFSNLLVTLLKDFVSKHSE